RPPVHQCRPRPTSKDSSRPALSTRQRNRDDLARTIENLSRGEQDDTRIDHRFEYREGCQSIDEVCHLITLSARYSTDCGIVRLSAFAVLRLMTNSNVVGCSTGRSAGLAPLRILSTNTATRRAKCI